jgi:serine/threonine protein kinase
VVGRTISHYKITEKLGEGGMGIVYKAEDTKLERTVALKFLASHLLNDEEAKARFLREAKAAAALNHPNICTVYQIHSDGQQLFLAMEFIEGKDVRRKIKQGPLELEQALDIAIQAGLGLQVAHEKVIVHRDIKSANLIVTPQGHVKVMDFGLALLSDRTKLTRTGSVAGTPAYMSPEQALGEKADRRTDIWSLAVVIYEMVAGRLPFEGEYDQAVIYALVHEDHKPITSLRAGVPIELDRILEKALAKGVEDRYQHVEEMLVDLRALTRQLNEASRSRGPVAVSDTSRPDRKSTRAWAMALAALLVAAFIIWMIIPPDRGGFVLGEPATYPYPPPDGTQFEYGLTVSPNGQYAAFVADTSPGEHDLWVGSVNDSSRTNLLVEDIAGGGNLFWSPNSEWIAFWSDDELKRVSINSKTVVPICECGGRKGAWGKDARDGDGTILFAQHTRTRGGLMRVPASGGEPTPATTISPQGPESHFVPHFLSDGRRFIYLARRFDAETGRFDLDSTALYAGTLEESADSPANTPSVDTELLKVASNAEYVPPLTLGQPGYLLYHRQQALLAQPFDEETLKLQGEPRVVAENLWTSVTIGQFSLSRSGVLLYREPPGLQVNQLVWVNRNGETVGQEGKLAHWLTCRLSSDETKAVCTKGDRLKGSDQISVVDFERDGIETIITTKGGWPRWSPDDRDIYFRGRNEETNRQALYRKRADGSGEADVVCEAPEIVTAMGPETWSSDGRLLMTWEKGLDQDIYAIELGAEPCAEPLIATDAREAAPNVSPNGQWLAYTSGDIGPREVYIQRLDGSSERDQVSASGGSAPRWRGDSKELFYVNIENELMAVPIESSGESREIELGSHVRLFRLRTPQPISRGFYQYDVTSDGQRFLVISKEREEAATVVLNWQAGLEE